MTLTNYSFDWSDLAFSKKTDFKKLKPVFIAAPRHISNKRFKEIVKTYLPKGNILLGIAREPYVDGFEGQPQFKMLKISDIAKVIGQVNRSGLRHKIYVLNYFQRELPFILEKIYCRQVVFINASWKRAFHVTKPYYILSKKHLSYELVSPFCDEKEARNYEAQVARESKAPTTVNGSRAASELLEVGMMDIAEHASKNSFDHTFQVGLALGHKQAGTSKYRLLGTAYNQVVPWQAFAMHYGSEREKKFSLPQDTSHYDTVHAETDILIQAQKQKLDLKNTAVFVTMMPCPACARMLCRTDIAEVVYRLDHSDGYALSLLARTNKKIRRLN